MELGQKFLDFATGNTFSWKVSQKNKIFTTPRNGFRSSYAKHSKQSNLLSFENPFLLLFDQSSIFWVKSSTNLGADHLLFRHRSMATDAKKNILLTLKSNIHNVKISKTMMLVLFLSSSFSCAPLRKMFHRKSLFVYVMFSAVKNIKIHSSQDLLAHFYAKKLFPFNEPIPREAQ
jgi:hypothetical protein